MIILEVGDKLTYNGSGVTVSGEVIEVITNGKFWWESDAKTLVKILWSCEDDEWQNVHEYGEFKFYPNLKVFPM